MDAIAAIRRLRQFIAPNQLSVIGDLCRGEEKEFFFRKMVELASLIVAMPKTYEQSHLGDEAIVSLHYFKDGMDFFITEKDVGEGEADPPQLQAFGLADLFGDGGEMGYISIVELLENNLELDLYFTPCKLGELRVKRASPTPEDCMKAEATRMRNEAEW
jgi:hypothetical protein